MDSEQKELFKKYVYYGQRLRHTLDTNDKGQRTLRRKIAKNITNCLDILKDVKRTEPKFCITQKKVVFVF